MFASAQFCWRSCVTFFRAPLLLAFFINLQADDELLPPADARRNNHTDRSADCANDVNSNAIIAAVTASYCVP